MSLALAIPHLVVGLRDRTARAHLLFPAAAAAAAATGVMELLLMRAGTVERFAVLLRWAHIPFLILFASLVWFVRTNLGAGRRWLAWTAIGTRAFATLVLNFLSPVNISYTALTGLRPVPVLGESVLVPEGIENPWVRVGELSALLLLVYLVDAGVTLWRRRERSQALAVVGSMALFILVAATHAALLHAGVIFFPYVVSISFVGVLVAMDAGLGWDLLRARATVRKLVESEWDLRELEQRLRLVQKAASIGMWGWDVGRATTGTALTANDYRGGAPFETGSLAAFLATVHTDDRDGIREAVERSLTEGSDFEREYRAEGPDGQMRSIVARGDVERDAAGTPVRIRGVSLDITPRRQLEAELLERHKELAHLSRVAMLAELSGSLAHELNQPLTAILSNAQAAQRLLGRDVPELEDVREILKDIVDEDRRAGEIIQRLRLLLKKGDVCHEPVDVSEAVDDVLKIMRSDLVNQGVDVTVAAAIVPSPHVVVGDRVQLQQVLLNLVVNGCDAIRELPAGERRLHVTTEMNGSGRVHVSVRDRGVGIPEADLARIFDPFVTTKANGLGLGLSVCRTIIGAHGGEIWAANNAGEAGATVQFALPALAEQA